MSEDKKTKKDEERKISEEKELRKKLKEEEIILREAERFLHQLTQALKLRKREKKD